LRGIAQGDCGGAGDCGDEDEDVEETALEGYETVLDKDDNPLQEYQMFRGTLLGNYNNNNNTTTINIHPFSPTVAAENKNLHTTNITRNLTKHRLYIKVTNKIYWWNRDAKPYERVHLGPLSKRRSVPCGSHLVPGGSQFVGQAYL